MLSNGMILLVSGIALLIVSFCMLFVFIHSMKKQKVLAVKSAAELGTTAILPKNNIKKPSDETVVDTSTIPMISDETAMMNNVSDGETELIDD